MKIGKNLPKFENSPSLLIVAGWQSGKIFYAFDGEISLDKEINVPDHKYSDKEGFFKKMTSKIKGSFGSGSVLEKKKEHIREKFLNLFIKEINNRVKKYKIEDIYLFSPQEGLNGLKGEMPKGMRDKIRHIYKGNYIKHDPLNILEIIEKEKPEPVQVMSEEAKKILEKRE